MAKMVENAELSPVDQRSSYSIMWKKRRIVKPLPLDETELKTISVAELKKLTDKYPEDHVKEMRHHRRRLKNREYAKTSRDNKTKIRNRLEIENSQLKDSLDTAQQTIRQLQTDLQLLRSKVPDYQSIPQAQPCNDYYRPQVVEQFPTPTLDSSWGVAEPQDNQFGRLNMQNERSPSMNNDFNDFSSFYDYNSSSFQLGSTYQRTAEVPSCQVDHISSSCEDEFAEQWLYSQ